MRFSLNLVNIVPYMGNEYDEQIQDIDPRLDLAWEIIGLLAQRKIEFEVVDWYTGTFLEIDVPDELLRTYGYFDEPDAKEKEAGKVRPLTEFLGVK
ncbi:hypothetical protein [Thermococcus barophilus]|nr:hypothetical protein [Thermococcus barophilus]